MTGAEQTTVNELANLTRGLSAEQADFRAEVRAEFAAVRSDIRVLQDDKVARDARAAMRQSGLTVSWQALAAMLTLAGIVAGAIVRVVGA